MYSEKSYLRRMGFTESCRRRYPCKSDGSPLPWMNYSIICFLEERLNRNLRMFEYGSGYSTRFFAGIVESITSVEHDCTWADYIEDTLPNNATLLKRPLVDGDSYVNAARLTNMDFDVILVDGRRRMACMNSALEALSETGVIILDDSHRDRYQAGIVSMRQRGFRKLDFTGLKPKAIAPFTTTLFYRDGNCLSI